MRGFFILLCFVLALVVLYAILSYVLSKLGDDIPMNDDDGDWYPASLMETAGLWLFIIGGAAIWAAAFFWLGSYYGCQ